MQVWHASHFVSMCIKSRGFPVGSDGKESACNAGDLSLIPGLGRSPGGGNGSPLQVFLPGEFHGQRSLAGYSPWGHTELDRTERLKETQKQLFKKLKYLLDLEKKKLQMPILAKSLL